MARPKGQGKTPGSGRKAGTPNKVTADIRALAQQHGEMAIRELVRIARNSDNESTRVSALKELLDRGYGKARQPITGNQPEDPVAVIERVVQNVTNPDG